jgi:putative NADH-flavin reductase
MKHNIIVFGGQGRTGSEVVAQALVAGHKVTAFVYKDNGSLPKNNNLKVYTGNARNYKDVLESLKGIDTVINIIAPKIGDKKNYDISLVATENIVKAMQQVGIKRYFGQCGAWATERLSDASWLMQIGFKVFLPLKNIYKYKKLEDAVVKNSGLSWTIARCAILNDKPLKWPIRVFEYGYKCGPFEIPHISRKSVAKFYIENLDSNEFINTAPDILE